MVYDLAFIFILFISYSFAGWFFETLLFTIQEKKFVNRGFLVGPLCPIYGIASLLFIFGLNSYIHDPLVLFILITLIATILEYITSYTLEKLFNVRWWDYSKRSFNFNGRIALANSIVFGGLGLILIYIVNPIYTDILNASSVFGIILIAIVAVVIFIIDIVITSQLLFTIKKTTTAMRKDRTIEISTYIKSTLSSKLALAKRLFNAFPDPKEIERTKIIAQIKDYINKTKNNS